MILKTERNIIISILLFTCLVIAACGGCHKKNSYQPRKPIEAEPYPVKLERFDRELFSVDTNRLHENLLKLALKYDLFYTSYANDVMSMPFDSNDRLFERPMRILLGMDRLRELAYIVDSNFKNMAPFEEQFSRAMGVYHQEFPKAVVPRFVTFISEFGNGNIIYDSMLCIGLDFYMKERFVDFYRGLKMPEFMINKMQPNYIVPNTLKSLGIGLTDMQTTKDKRFIAQVIVEGKIRYFMKTLLPEIPDTVVMGYSAAQLKWCEENEAEIWTHFIDKNMLYESEPGKFMRYLNDGPFTVAEDVPKESSPAIGAWAGWRIVNAYMEKNPTVSLQELMQEADFEKILKQSKYRPQ